MKLLFPVAKISHLSELLKGGVISLILKGLAGVVGFFVNLAVARSLGAEGAGLFFLSLSVVVVFSTMARLGFDQSVTRFAAMYFANGNLYSLSQLYNTAFFLVIFASSTFSLILFMTVDRISVGVFHKPDLTLVLSTMCWAVLPFSVVWLHASFFQALKKIVYFQLFQNLALNSIFIILFWLLLFHLSEHAIFLSGITFLVSSVLVAVGACYIWRIGSYVGGSGFLRRDQIKQFMSASFPLFGVSMLALATLWVGQLILGFYRPSEEVAIYSAALRTAAILSLVVMAANSVVLPKFASLYAAKDLEALRALSVWATRLSILCCFPGLFVVCFFSTELMNLFGHEFVAGSNALIVLGVGQFIYVLGGSSTGVLSMTGNGHILFLGNAIGAITMVILCLLLVESYGFLGIAAAQAIALVIQSIVNNIFVLWRFGFSPMNIWSIV